MSAGNFPLPTLGEKLLKSALDIHRGRGFSIIRGLDPKDLSPEDNLIVFLGISSYIGSQRGRQDEDGNMLSTCPRRFLTLAIAVTFGRVLTNS